MFDAGRKPEILTVDNHADGPYLYLKMRQENPDACQRSIGIITDE